MALIHEIRAGQMQTSGGDNDSSNNNPTDVFLLSMSRQNFQAVLNAVFKMEQYWAGVTNVSQLLEKRLSNDTLCQVFVADTLQGRGSQDRSLVNSKAPLYLYPIKGYYVDSVQIHRIHNTHPPKRVYENLSRVVSAPPQPVDPVSSLGQRRDEV
jgi:hypothetical protein